MLISESYKQEFESKKHKNSTIRVKIPVGTLQQLCDRREGNRVMELFVQIVEGERLL